MTVLLIILLFIHVLSRELEIPPYATWNQVAETVSGLSNGTKGNSRNELNLPIGISISENDILYISDGFNNRIVVVPLNSSREIFSISIASNIWQSQFNYPYDVVVRNTALFANDKRNYRVVKMTLNGLNPTTVLDYNSTLDLCYLFVDDYDNIYLNDRSNHRVLFFCANSSNFTIVAGTGVNGSNNTQLNRPYGIYVDHENTLYVADFGNHRVVKWIYNSTSGIVVAGNGTYGTSLSKIFFPTQVIVDKNGYMYISENVNHRIMRWAPNSTYGMCIAACTGTNGSTSYHLLSPHSLAFDSSGSLYVSDYRNNRVQKFQIRHIPTSYNQPKLSPNAKWNENGSIIANYTMIGRTPHTIFVDKNNTVYAVNRHTNQIFIWYNGTNLTVYNTSFNFRMHSNLFVTYNGEIYYVNNQSEVYKWSIDATNPTFVTRFSNSCYSLFIDINNYLYCTLKEQHQIVRFSLDINITNVTTIIGDNTAGSNAHQFNKPWGIFVDRDLNLYVADSRNHRIQRFFPGDKNARTVAKPDNASNITLDYPTDMILDADNNLYIVNNNNHRIIRSINGKLECIIACTGQNGSNLNQLSKPYAMRFDSYGNLYVVDEYNDRIIKFTLTTNSFETATTTTTTTHTDKIISYNLPRLCQKSIWNSNGTAVLNNNELKSPYTIFITNDNTAYVTSHENNNILMWSLVDTNQNSKSIMRDRLNNPTGLFVTIDGNVYISNNNNNEICKYPPNADNCDSIILGSVKSCFSLFVDIQNNLYCSMKGEHKVLKTLLQDTVSNWTIIAGTDPGGKESNQLSEPLGIFVDKNLILYVADSNNNRIQKFQPGNTNGTTVAGENSAIGQSLRKPYAIIIDADDYLYVADYENHRIVRIKSEYFECVIACSNKSGDRSDQLNNPKSLAFDSFGNIFVADHNNNRIQKFHLITNSCNETISKKLANICPINHNPTTPDEQINNITTSIAVASSVL